MEIDKDTKDKKTSELHSTILRLETEVQRLSQFTFTYPVYPVIVVITQLYAIVLLKNLKYPIWEILKLE